MPMSTCPVKLFPLTDVRTYATLVRNTERLDTRFCVLRPFIVVNCKSRCFARIICFSPLVSDYVTPVCQGLKHLMVSMRKKSLKHSAQFTTFFLQYLLHSDVYRWKPDSDGHVPEDAVVAGVANDGAPLFIARGRINDEPVVGKLHFGHPCAYFPYGGEEIAQDNYEILVWMK
ncbi:uncharacterized protein DEA37_0014322 [Paragonimus westermani]|uniref:Uncharacterized protein n=1 Tax=Paragonimus westermani TaxID=34504 RepID=A0A5J4NFQ6_9TREM|nr:uncharacterized protein DEA37_0014322 [Paragonimus westermani]